MPQTKRVAHLVRHHPLQALADDVINFILHFSDRQVKIHEDEASVNVNLGVMHASTKKGLPTHPSSWCIDILRLQHHPQQARQSLVVVSHSV